MTWTAAGLRALAQNGTQTNFYIGLIDSSDTELSGNGYTRPAIGTGQYNYESAFRNSKFNIQNSARVNFPTATGAWSAPAKFGLYSAASGGTQYGVWDFPGDLNPPALQSGDQHTFASRALEFQVEPNEFTVRGITQILDRGIAGTTLYVGLSVGTTELSGNAYARVRVAGSGWTIPSSLTGNDLVITNTSSVTFPTPTRAWNDATHIVLYSAATGGNLYLRDTLDNNPAAGASGGTVAFNAGDIELKISRS